MRFGIGTESDVRITFSLDRKFHLSVWKIMIPLILLVTLRACVPHWAGVL